MIRLTRVAGGTTETYAYSPTANRVATVTLAGNTRSFSYLTSGQVSQDVRNPAQTYSFAANDNGRNASGSLNAVTVGTYLYNAFEQRAQKTGAAVTQFVYDRFGHLLTEASGSGAAQKEYLWLDDVPVVPTCRWPNLRFPGQYADAVAPRADSARGLGDARCLTAPQPPLCPQCVPNLKTADFISRRFFTHGARTAVARRVHNKPGRTKASMPPKPYPVLRARGEPTASLSAQIPQESSCIRLSTPARRRRASRPGWPWC